LAGLAATYSSKS